MAIEMFSWPSLHKRMCRTWGSNSGLLACQADMLPIELPRQADIQIWAASWQNEQNDCTQWRLRSAWASAQTDHLRCPHEESLGPKLPIEHTAKTDQTGRMPRLIWVFAGCTCHFVGFVMLWLILNISSLNLPEMTSMKKNIHSILPYVKI